MILALEVAAGLVSAFAMLMLMATLPAIVHESAFLLAYVVSAALLAGLAVFLKHLWNRPPEWRHLGLFLVVGLLTGSACGVLFWLAAGALNLVDSSHGGSVFIVALATVAACGLGAVSLSERIRRGGAL